MKRLQLIPVGMLFHNSTLWGMSLFLCWGPYSAFESFFFVCFQRVFHAERFSEFIKSRPQRMDDPFFLRSCKKRTH